MRNGIIFALTLSIGVSMAFAGRLKNLHLDENQPDINYNLTDGIKSRLNEHGFLLRSSSYKTIYDLYSEYKDSPYTPLFISADLPLHTLHLMVDNTVRIMEMEELLPKLENLTKAMLKLAEKDLATHKGKLKDAAHAQYMYMAVAARLLDPQVDIKKEFEKQVEIELAKIEAHQGIAKVSFLPDIKEDYSQYQPRGHYTRSKDFERYFKTMMWFGRLPLNIPPDKKSLLPMQTAFMISLNLETNTELKQLWSEIYEPTAFFFGTAEDLTPSLMISEAKSFFGTKTALRAADSEKMREFALYLRKTVKPKILSEFASSAPDMEAIEVPLSLRFMPQRFIPDSYIFSQLVFDKVTRYTGKNEEKPFTWGMTQDGAVRVFPRGLDLMSVLGWKNATAILEKEGDTDFLRYNKQLDKMTQWYTNLTAKEKLSSIYTYWFELFNNYRTATAPPLTNAELWENKKLLTGLASWTELRHDAILYAKQSYTVWATAAAPGDYTEPPPPLYLAVIENAPELYSQIAKMARLIADFYNSEDRNFINDTYTQFAKMMEKMNTLASKQATNTPLTAKEHKWLYEISSEMEYLPQSLGDAITNDADSHDALVADVHSDPNSAQVLEEATGNPAEIYVLVKINDKKYIARGGTFTYYEFKHPMNDRLTDKAWQKMLNKLPTPVPPTWTKDIIAN